MPDHIVGCYANGRYVQERGLRRVVVATCRADVIAWLRPDWIFDLAAAAPLLVGRELPPWPEPPSPQVVWAAPFPRDSAADTVQKARATPAALARRRCQELMQLATATSGAKVSSVAARSLPQLTLDVEMADWKVWQTAPYNDDLGQHLLHLALE